MLRSWLVALLTVLVLSQSLPRSAYRDLQSCPDLTPLDPPIVAATGARRCARVFASASRRYVNRVPKARATCLLRVQAGELVGTLDVLCRGLVRLSTGGFDPPTDVTTAAAISVVETELRRAIEDAGTDADAIALEGCAPTANG